MLLDSIDDNDKYEHYRWLHAAWSRKFALWPRKCHLTGKTIWLTKGFVAEILVPGSFGHGDRGEVVRWHSVESHIIWLLRNV